jgi:hypothetical protein
MFIACMALMNEWVVEPGMRARLCDREVEVEEGAIMGTLGWL